MTRGFIFHKSDLFDNCHASTLTVLPNGDILAAWFAGSKEGAPDVDIWGAIRQSGEWSTAVRWAGEEGLPHWNPVLFRGAHGVVYLFYKVGHKISTWTTRVSVSQDGGSTWSEPSDLVSNDVGGRGPVKNKPIVLTNGWWVAPASVESDLWWNAFVDISIDGGLSWDAMPLVPVADRIGKGVIQPSLWESAPGHVHMLLRSTAGFLYRSDSMDYGVTWCPAYLTDIPNNNSGMDMVSLRDGTLVLVSNPVSGNWAERTPLTVSFSMDNGFTWSNSIVLEEGPGEFSYPSVIADGHVYITYTYKRESIVFCDLELSE